MPNCIDVWAGRDAYDAAWLDTGSPPGPVAIVSQPGEVGVDFMSYATEFGLGLSHSVSIGNQADLVAADTPDAGAIGVYCEGFHDRRAFLAAVEHAIRRDKPVLVIAPAGAAATRAARSHTGSSVSDERIVAAGHATPARFWLQRRRN